MKIGKKVLTEALRVLGKMVSQTSPETVLRQVRFLGCGNTMTAMATDGREVIALRLEAEAKEDVDFAVEYKALREIVRTAKGAVELQGVKATWPEMPVVPADAESIDLPENFAGLLALAAPVVDRFEVRRTLQGIDLSADGIAVTDGRQLLHLPVNWSLKTNLALPFPHALLAAAPQGPGKLWCWSDCFKLEIGSFSWTGRSLGNYPNWKQVIPEDKALDYRITLRETEPLTAFLKTAPDHPPFHGIEFNVTPEGVVVIPMDFPGMELKVDAEFTGVRPRAVLSLNKYTLLRMLQQGYHSFRAHSDGMMPVIAEGGAGRFIAMPLRMNRPAAVPSPTQSTQTNQPTQEVKTMEQETKKPEVEPISAFDELNANVEELRSKLKSLCEDSAVLVRKIKEAALQQKQKEREFIQAKRAIERIKMAI